MEHIFIKDVKPGVKISSSYLLLSVDERSKKNGESFYSLTLGDSTGSISAVMWDNFEVFTKGSIKSDDYVYVQGDVTTYQDSTQLVVKNIRKIKEDEINPVDFLPHTPYDINTMFDELKANIKIVKQRELKELLKQIFSDTEIINGYKSAPSALSMHQAYIGGLLEHTIGVVRNCIAISENYSNNYSLCDIDLLITGALIHDMGKIYEFEWMPKIQYSDRGRLLGHIIIGIEMLEKFICGVENFPENLKTLLNHLIISHHGLLEWGSPKRPKTLEAIILHFADNIDAKLTTYIQECTKAREKGLRWTDYNKMFERYLFAGFDETHLISDMQEQEERDIPYRDNKPSQPELF